MLGKNRLLKACLLILEQHLDLTPHCLAFLLWVLLVDEFFTYEGMSVSKKTGFREKEGLK